MEISFHSHLDSNTVIATKFCTCKNLLRSDGQRRNYGEAKFTSNLNCGQKNVSEMGPWTPLNGSGNEECLAAAITGITLPIHRVYIAHLTGNCGFVVLFLRGVTYF